MSIAEQENVVQSFAWRLATCELLPSISHSDLVQGSNDE